MATGTVNFTTLGFTCPKCGLEIIRLYSDREFVELGHDRFLRSIDALYCDACEEDEIRAIDREIRILSGPEDVKPGPETDDKDDGRGLTDSDVDPYLWVGPIPENDPPDVQETDDEARKDTD